MEWSNTTTWSMPAVRGGWCSAPAWESDAGHDWRRRQPRCLEAPGHPLMYLGIDLGTSAVKAVLLQRLLS
jgi:hypothetical protein